MSHLVKLCIAEMVSFPARIHVLLASDQPIGVVIRRGPSKHVCTLLWNRSTDEFTLAQWLKGRIYERRSDLSPDGRYLIYFAMNGRWNSESRGSWTAISRAPWLQAVTLFSKGDCWHGGGLFTSNLSYWLNGGCGHRLIQDSGEVHADAIYKPPGCYGGECPSVYYVRLQRDGWAYLSQNARRKRESLHLFEKVVQGWILRKLAHEEIGAPAGKGCYWDEHELEHRNTGTVLAYPDWEWAEWDRDRLVWATGGCLYTGCLTDDALKDIKLIYDFNHLQFQPLAAPY